MYVILIPYLKTMFVDKWNCRKKLLHFEGS